MFGLIIAMISIGCMVQAPALAFVVLPLWLMAGYWALSVHYGTPSLNQEWRAMWRPLTRWLPRLFALSPCALMLLLGLPALVLAHTIGTLLALR